MWIQDDVGSSLLVIDDWTQIHDSIKGVVSCTNSKRGKYSEKRIRLTPPMGSPLIDISGSLNDSNSREVTRTALGTRLVNGVISERVLIELAIFCEGFRKDIELEAWMTEKFIFLFNVIFTVRFDGGEQ